MTRSSGARVWSKSKPYWKPEQPPPDTLMRSAVPPGSPDEDLGDSPGGAFGEGDGRDGVEHLLVS